MRTRDIFLLAGFLSSSVRSRDYRTPKTLAKLNIPERHRAALSSIRSLSEQDTQQIRAILDEATSSTPQGSNSEHELPSDPGAAITAVRKAAPRIGISNFTKLMDVLISLYEVKSQRDVSVEEFVDDVCDAMERLDHPDQRLH